MPGSWQASDGNWYPPEVHPDVVNSASVTEDGRPQGTSTEAAITPAVPSTSPRPTLQIAGLLTLTVLLVAGGFAVGKSLAGAQSADHQSTQQTSPAATGVSPVGTNPRSVGATVPTTGESTTTTSSPTGVSSPGGTVPVGPGTPTYPAPSTAVGPSSDPITPAVEAAVTSSTWAGLTTALVYGDQGEIPTYATPSESNALVGILDCGCGPGPPSYSAVNFSAVPQSTYPLAFLAEFQGKTYGQAPATRHVVFTKADAASPWLVAFDADYIKGQPFLPSSMTGPIAGPDMGPALRKATQDFADYFQTVDSTGNVGTGTPTGFANDNILSSDVSGSASIYPGRAAAKLTDTYTHSIDAISPTFAVDSGGTELCFAMRVHDVVSPVGAARIVQPADQSVWGNRIAPGSYHHLDILKESEDCLVTAPSSAIYLVADAGATYQESAS